METKPVEKCAVCKIEDGTLRPPRVVVLKACPRCGVKFCVDCLAQHTCK